MSVLEFDFTLSEDLQYAKQGKMTKSKTLLLKAPKVRHLPLTARLKEILTKAFMEQSKGASVAASEDTGDSSGGVDLSGEMLLMLIMSAGNADYSYFVDFCDKFKALMLSELCLIDGEQKINQATYDDISDSDIESLMGEYTLNFLLPKEIKKNMKL